ncbi:MAG: TolB family protein, partial [Acidimicrobiia bacterium]
IFSFEDAGFYGSTGNVKLNKPIVGMAPTPTGRGYWFVAADGGIFSFGDAAFRGSTGNVNLNKPIVGMAPTPTGRGYWFVAADGGIFSFGDAGFHGSTGNVRLNKPIVGMAATPSGKGYWFVAADGGMFVFGDAKFWGSTAKSAPRSPIVGMAATPSGNGYWLVGADGAVYPFGDAKFLGSMGGKPLTLPVVGMSATPSGAGYWLVASDGGIFAFGDAAFHGSTGDVRLNQPIVGMATVSLSAPPLPGPGGTSPTTGGTSPTTGGTTPTTGGTTPTTSPPPLGLPGDPGAPADWGPAGTTARVEKGTSGGGDAFRPWVSANGRFVAFDSSADNILGKNPDGTTRDQNGIRDVFVYDRVASTYTRMSVDSAGTEAVGPTCPTCPGNQRPTISANGRYVAWWSDATNLVAGDNNGHTDAFVRDRDTDADGIYDEAGAASTIRVSVATNGTQGNNDSKRPVISRDGRFVAFESYATNLVGSGSGLPLPSQFTDSNGANDVFLYELSSGTTTLISTTSSRTAGNGDSDRPSMSGDGRWVAFNSSATNLVANDANAKTDVFVRDMNTGSTRVESTDVNGVQANNGSLSPAISADGRWLSFDSNATNLVTGQDGGAHDVYLKDRHTGTVTRVSNSTSGGQANGSSHDSSISGDGRFVAFWSEAGDIVAGDTNTCPKGTPSCPDIFVYDRQTGTTQRVSVSSTGAQAEAESFAPALSMDGRFVAWDSKATTLAAGGTSGQDIFVHVNY